MQKGIRRAVEAVTSGIARLKRGERTSRPHFTADSVVYDKRSATFSRDSVSLSTPDGRVECDYVLPDDTSKPPSKYLTDEWGVPYGDPATPKRRVVLAYLHAKV